MLLVCVLALPPRMLHASRGVAKHVAELDMLSSHKVPAELHLQQVAVLVLLIVHYLGRDGSFNAMPVAARLTGSRCTNTHRGSSSCCCCSIGCQQAGCSACLLLQFTYSTAGVLLLIQCA